MKKVIAYIILIILALLITVGIVYKILEDGWLPSVLTFAIAVVCITAFVWALKTIDP